MSVVTVNELYLEQATVVQVPNMQIWQAAPGLISNHLTDKSINSYKTVVGNPFMLQHLHFPISSHVALQVNRTVSAKSFTLCRSSTNIGFHRSISGWQWAPFCPWAIINRNIIFTKTVQSLGIPTSNRAISFLGYMTVQEWRLHEHQKLLITYNWSQPENNWEVTW
jgi:hypothetical protein